MADLVTLANMKTFLGISGTAQDTVLQLVLDGVEEAFNAQCGRQSRPFQPAQTARVEFHDGTGRAVLYLDYPVESISEILIGPDFAAPTETLAPADLTIVSWRQGSARLTRVDNRVWGTASVPNAIRVTYDSQDDLPTNAPLAITRVTATVFRQLGAEDVKSERSSTYSRDLAQAGHDDPIWCMAVRACGEVRV